MNITVADLVQALKAGQNVTVIINGEYYTITGGADDDES